MNRTFWVLQRFSKEPWTQSTPMFLQRAPGVSPRFLKTEKKIDMYENVLHLYSNTVIFEIGFFLRIKLVNAWSSFKTKKSTQTNARDCDNFSFKIGAFYPCILNLIHFRRSHTHKKIFPRKGKLLALLSIFGYLASHDF